MDRYLPAVLWPLSWWGSFQAPPLAGQPGWRRWSRRWLRLSCSRPPRSEEWRTPGRCSESRRQAFSRGESAPHYSSRHEPLFRVRKSRSHSAKITPGKICQVLQPPLLNVKSEAKCRIGEVAPSRIHSVKVPLCFLFFFSHSNNPIVSWERERNKKSQCLTTLSDRWSSETNWVTDPRLSLLTWMLLEMSSVRATWSTTSGSPGMAAWVKA